MQDTTSSSSFSASKLKSQQIVPEYQDENNGNSPILNKDFVHFGTNKQKGYHRGVHIQQVNETFLYEGYEDRKRAETGMDAPDSSTSLGRISARNSFDEPLGLNGSSLRPGDDEVNKIHAITPQLDGLKDLNSIAPILSPKHLATSPRLDDAQSDLSSVQSFSPSTSSFSNHEDQQTEDRRNKYGQNETKCVNSEQQLMFEKDKKAIYRHPLFPLLSTLFEKCELATKSIELGTTYNFNAEAQSFMQQRIKDKKELACEDSEVNELMIKALQVLRIHLLELEKVQDLCKDFCNRYITCLRGKMQSENLLRTDYGGYDSDDSGSGGSLGKDTSVHSVSPMPSIA